MGERNLPLRPFGVIGVLMAGAREKQKSPLGHLANAMQIFLGKPAFASQFTHPIGSVKGQSVKMKTYRAMVLKLFSTF